VAAVLSEVGSKRGLPAVIQFDQGTEFTSNAMDHWAHWNKVNRAFSRPCTVGDNARYEAFNGSLRRACLSHGHFTSLFRTCELR
jgi:putative transposase